ncbi:MAG: hypothetical protein CMP39_01145 [Rickettsiales bacterium]|nr:hypothetical protein [Rickettsiales bacterium]
MIETIESKTLDTNTKIQYSGSTSQIFKIWILNLLLNIITVGIYGFWGRTRMRQYIINRLSLSNDNLEYSGTGKELFLGFLKCLPLFIVIIILLNVNLLASAVAILIFYFSYIAIYNALRYRASRITWRGIRTKLEGSAIKFTHLNIKRTLINILTFGFSIPSSQIKIFNYIVNNSYFGNTKFTLTEKKHSLSKTHIITMLLIPLTLGLSRNWYKAKLYRFYCESISFNNIQFEGHHTGLSLLKLNIVNILIRIFTLGFGVPFVIQRNINYLTDNISIIGVIDTTNINQSNEEIKKTGEGLIEFFDIDLDFGLI